MSEELIEGMQVQEEQRQVPEPQPVEQQPVEQASQGVEGMEGPEELLVRLQRLMEGHPVQEIRTEVEAIKTAFYKQTHSEEDETRFKALYDLYRKHRDEYMATERAAEQANLKVKEGVIEELKALVAGEDDGGIQNDMFEKFRALQTRWRETGPVPMANVKELWENYHLQVENFYNVAKINRELRDLDLKKNLEAKTALAEAAEALADEPQVIEAFRKLQKLHDDWREIGPVAMEYKEPLWERFKAASTVVNKRHQDHFDKLREAQLANLERKTALCEAAEKLVEQLPVKVKGWEAASEQLVALQKEWRTIGYAPKKDNNAIWERFRKACDAFFAAKHIFFKTLKEDLSANLKIKTELVEKAEALKDSEAWKEATDELIALQARWKEIGAVPQKVSNELWARFRAACDAFFECKAAFYAARKADEATLRRTPQPTAAKGDRKATSKPERVVHGSLQAALEGLKDKLK